MWIIVSGALLHTVQRKGMSIPLLDSKAWTRMLWWQHCQRKHLIFGRDDTFHTHSPLKACPTMLLSSHLARWYASFSLKSPLGEEYQEVLLKTWHSNTLFICFTYISLQISSQNWRLLTNMKCLWELRRVVKLGQNWPLPFSGKINSILPSFPN